MASNRFLLINWARQTITDAAIIIFAYLVYSKVIITKQNLMPDFNAFAEELWIIIAIFIYQVLNRIKLSSSASIKRKENYIDKRFVKFKSKYHSIITKKIQDKKLIAVVYSIMIYEDFNRPKIIRLVENIYQRIGSKPRSLGVMQVISNKFINDYESVIMAVEKINDHYCKVPEIIKEARISYGYDSENLNEKLENWEIEREILADYNPDDKYINEVSRIIIIISAKLNYEDLEYSFKCTE
ncbi:MAG: hypothetical protein PHQ74_07940 [Crocinitomicaceae bacterium]|nr:hypothetical protein [Crocinitomicaceae bacterium]